MGAEVIRLSRASLAPFREVVANPDLHDVVTVLDACDRLTAEGDWLDADRARLLRAAINRHTCLQINRRCRWARRTRRAARWLFALAAALFLIDALLRLY